MNKPFVVVVGTIAKTATPDPDAAGMQVWGPFDGEEAEQFRTDVEAVWKDVDPELFHYGDPYAEVKRIHPPRTVFASTPARKAAENWFAPEDEDES